VRWATRLVQVEALGVMPGLRSLVRRGRACGAEEFLDDDGQRLTRDGRPYREDAEQGALGDAGLIAVLGTVAAHFPREVGRRLIGQDDGSYLAVLNRVRRARRGAVPSGRFLELEVTPELPVYDHSPGEPAYAKADGGTWATIMEKAFAGVDQTWTMRRRARWARGWPEGEPPSGYVRLDQGFDPLDCAEALAQLTGRRGVVRRFAAQPGWVMRILRRHARTGYADSPPPSGCREARDRGNPPSGLARRDPAEPADHRPCLRGHNRPSWCDYASQSMGVRASSPAAPGHLHGRDPPPWHDSRA
jgi:hypothetical protein